LVTATSSFECLTGSAEGFVETEVRSLEDRRITLSGSGSKSPVM